jgi:fucose permease
LLGSGSADAGWLRRARVTVAIVFFVNGFVYASWVPRLAEIQGRLDLSEGDLGLALLMVAIGAIVAMPVTGSLIARHGSRALTTLTLVLLGLGLPLIGLAGSFATLCLAFLFYGAAAGVLDVSMNAQGVAVERGYRRPIMSSLHGMFSIGAMAGAGATGLLASLGIGILAQFVAVGAFGALLGPLLRRFMLSAQADAGGQGQGFALPDRRLVALGVIAFCGLLGEGAMGDWSAVYLDRSLGAGVEAAAAAFAVFSLAMAAGRFTGDRVVARVGGAAVVVGGGALAAIGLGGTLLIGRPEAAIIGFGLVGAGLSCVFPVVLSAATRMPGISPGTAIAGICTIAYMGFLVGPPAIGGVAELTCLPAALGMVVLLFVAIAVLGNRTSERSTASAASKP